MLKKIVLFLILITWPISLYISNTFSNFIHYSLPFLDPKFAIFPLFFVIIYFKFKKPFLILISIFILILFIKPFSGQTIFISDHDAKEQIIQKGNLYNSIFLARLFQNKARTPLDKFTNNFFALTDPNNYFFGFAPRQITVDNQNLKKFPFLSLPFLFIGLYYLKDNKHKKIILAILIATIMNLCLLTNFDRNDFILWIPLFLIILNGLNIFNKRFKYAKHYEFIFIIFSLVEILRIFIMK